MRTLLALLCLVSLCSVWAKDSSSIGVRGCFKCGANPAAGVKVKLYDENRFSRESLVTQGTTDGKGCIVLTGTRDTLRKPKFNVYHKCGGVLKPRCYHKQTQMIPKGFISKGTTPAKYYGFGTTSLRMSKLPDCIV